MASTVKIVLHKNYKKKNGTYPIVLRITKDRKSRYIFTGEYILEKNWDIKEGRVKKSHPNSARLNNFLLKKLSEAHDITLNAETEEKTQSISSIRKKIVGDANVDFFFVAKTHLLALKKRKKVGQYRTEEGRLKIFQRFLNKTELSFIELDSILIKKFRNYLLYDRGVASRTAVNYLILIRTIYNLAINEYEIDARNYPFGKDKVQIRIPESEKIGLNIEEIQLLEKAKDSTPTQQDAINLWLLSFYFAGIRVGDILQLRWTDFRNGRLFYRMGKNEKLVSLGIPDKAKVILDIYLEKNQDKKGLVFSYLKESDLKNPQKLATRKNTITRNLNRRLACVAEKLGIEKKLSMHIARHSFGNISGDKIPIQMLQKLYRHSSIITTVKYQANFMHKEADDALEKVINF